MKDWLPLAIQHICRVLAAALAAWSAGAPTALLAQESSARRSTSDVRVRIPDELDRPRWRQTQSHRGWEIRESQYVIFANTSLDDARWAAGHVQQAWTNAAKLADRWSDVHRQPDSGLGSTQIVIDSEPPRERDAPLTTINVVGVQTQVYLYVATGQPGIKQQMLRLREGAAFAMLHSVALDSAVPPWVVQGLASYAAVQGLDPADVESARKVQIGARLGGQQWRYKRGAQDLLDYPAEDSAQAVSYVKFLLEANDAEHAGAFLGEIRESVASAEHSAAQGGLFSTVAHEDHPPATDTAFDRLIAQHAAQYESWQSDPLVGQPVPEFTEGATPELSKAEEEMLVVLKLERKLAGTPVTGRATPRVATFDRKAGRQVVESAQRPTAPGTIFELYRRLTDPSAPLVATLDVDGSLLLSSDSRRIEELLGRAGENYSRSKVGQRWVLARALEGDRSLTGWLAANPQNPGRPLAKFELVDNRATSRPSSRPVVQEVSQRPESQKR